MSWNRQAENLGNVKSGTTYTTRFTYSGDIKVDLQTLVVPCSCTKVKWEEDTKTIVVEYRPKPVPEHMKQQLHAVSYNDIKRLSINTTINGVIKTQEFSIIAVVFDNLPK